MRLLSFVLPSDSRRLLFGALVDDVVVDLKAAQSWTQGALGIPSEYLPDSLPELLQSDVESWGYVANLVEALAGKSGELTRLKGANRSRVGYALEEIVLFPPLLHPTSLRSFYAFEAHARALYAALKRDFPEEWLQAPVFTFLNPNAVYGPHQTIYVPSYSHELDFELQIACILGKAGKNIPAEEAADFIAGYTIANGWTARDVQSTEMKMGLGIAKAKDTALSLGPWMVTPEEIAYCQAGRPGVYDLAMTARVNGVERSRGNWRELHYSFGEMIAQASKDFLFAAG